MVQEVLGVVGVMVDVPDDVAHGLTAWAPDGQHVVNSAPDG
jgi:hypothetical protein